MKVTITIIPEDLTGAAELAVKQLAPTSEGESFTVALRPLHSTQTTPTHRASLPIVSFQAENQIRQLIEAPPFAGRCTIVSCVPVNAYSTFQSICQDLGLEEVPSDE